MATGRLGQLVRQSGLYAVGNAALKAAGFLLAPILLNPEYLSVAEYGYLALLLVSAQFVIYVSGLGLSTGLLRHSSITDAQLDHAALPFTAFAATIVAVLSAVVLLWAAAPVIASLLLDDASQALLVRLLALYTACKVLASVPLVRLRVEERAGTYALAVAIEAGVLVALVAFFLPGRDLGLEGVMLAYAGSAGAAALVLAGAMLRTVPWRFDRRSVSPLLRYGIPLVLASLAGWFLNAGDRYLLKWLADEVAVAGYEWAARLGGLVNVLLVQSFQLAFTVLGLKAIGAGDPTLYRRALRHYAAFAGLAVLALGLFTTDGMRLLIEWFGVDVHYLSAGRLVFPIAMGFGAYGVYIIVNNVLLAEGRTLLVGLNVLGAAVLNAALNVALIPYWGAMGAAVATLMSYAALAGVAAWAARRSLSIRYPWRAVAVVVAATTGLFLIGTLVDDWPTAGRMTVKAALAVAYGVVLIVTRVYGQEDWRVLRRILGR